METKKNKRFSMIKEILADGHFATKKELASILNLSVTTIQRDLIELEKEGEVIRKHGGVTISKDRKTTPLSNRICINYIEKTKIGKKATTLIDEGDTLFVETGTTCLSFFKNLSTNNVIVFTNSIAIASSDKIQDSNTNVFLLPGLIHKQNLAVYGNMTIESMDNINVNKSVFSCVGVCIDGRILCASEFDRGIINKISKNPKEKILLVDSSKFGADGAFTAASIDNIDIVITDSKIPDKFKQMILSKNKKLIIV